MTNIVAVDNPPEINPEPNNNDLQNSTVFIAISIFSALVALAGTLTAMTGAGWLLLLAVAPWVMLFPAWSRWTGWRHMFAGLISLSAVAALLTVVVFDRTGETSPEPPDAAKAEFSVDDRKGEVPRCTELTGQIRDVPAGLHPWLAWRGAGHNWYLKKVDFVDGGKYRLDLRMGAESQKGTAFVVKPILVSTAVHDVLQDVQASTKATPILRALPSHSGNFAAVEVERGENNCPN
ncbi:hypothetical protein AB0F81_41100 [Actinoplanes sp. NPDC024001]|uniref:hypothetical protein n=1 Tax=Actinoplanes sp. NPDC024001 TaxID=3154598 RepID=UPI0033ECDC9D